MSADNWAKCPKCHKEEVDHVAAIKKLYGKITLDEFEKRMAEAKAEAVNTSEETLREDYEIGILEGKFYVIYSASCECGFAYKFKHEKKIPL